MKTSSDTALKGKEQSVLSKWSEFWICIIIYKNRLMAHFVPIERKINFIFQSLMYPIT